MKNKKRFLFLILFVVMFAFTNVYAASTTSLSVSFREGSAGKGKVQYSLNDGQTWSDIEQNTNLNNLNVTGDNLRLKIVARDDNTIDWAGIELNGAIITEDNIKDALQSGDGYSVPANVVDASLSNIEFREGENNPQGGEHASLTISISGDTLEYDNPSSNDAIGMFFGINNSQERRGLEKSDVNFTTENNKIVGLTTKNPIDYEYDYNNEGTVTFHIMHQPGDVITSLKINNTSYNTPRTKEALIAAYSNNMISFDVSGVPYQNTYNIVIEGRALNEEEEFLAGFLWTYDANASQYADDDKILHGVLEFVKAEYDGHTYTTIEQVNNAGNLFKWKDAKKDSNDPMGEAVFPVGTELTVRLIPDAGYQLTSFDLNGFPFEPGEEVGLYTFTVGRGPFHLGAHFTEEGNTVLATSENVKNGTIDTNEEVEAGTLKLSVSNIGSMSPEREGKFVDTADEYEIASYMDISLYNAIYKGGKKDANGNYESWDTEVNDLANDARIALELSENMNGKEVVLVHEKHDGTYEIIETNYDSENNTITFETDSFSTYAIAYKESNTEEYTITDKNGNEISFTEVAGEKFILTIIDYLKLTDEEFQELTGGEVTKEQYNAVMNLIQEEVKDKGILISFYEIIVSTDRENEDNREVENGPFNIRIKLTDEMKKYEQFYIIYIDMDDEMNIIKKEPIELSLSKDGKYLEGTLKHLSKYVLTGTEAAANGDTEENVKTGDNIYTYVILLVISLIGLSILPIRYFKNKKHNI